MPLGIVDPRFSIGVEAAGEGNDLASGAGGTSGAGSGSGTEAGRDDWAGSTGSGRLATAARGWTGSTGVGAASAVIGTGGETVGGNSTPEGTVGGSSTPEGTIGGNSTGDDDGAGVGVEDSRTSGGGGSVATALGGGRLGGSSTDDDAWAGRQDLTGVGRGQRRRGGAEGAGTAAERPASGRLGWLRSSGRQGVGLGGKVAGDGSGIGPGRPRGRPGAARAGEPGPRREAWRGWAAARAEWRCLRRSRPAGSGTQEPEQDRGDSGGEVEGGSAGRAALEIGGGAGISALASWRGSVGANVPDAGLASAKAPGWTPGRPLAWATTLLLLTASRRPCWALAIPFLSCLSSSSFSSPWRASTARKKLSARAYSRYAR